jgi:site-specific DNA-methyltransferase (adenine-specific)
VNWNNLELPDRPYYQDDAVVIYHADCRDILPLIPDKSIDLVLTDPPFFMPAMHYQSRIRWQRSWGDVSILGIFWAAIIDSILPHLKETGHFITFCNRDSYPVFYPEMYRHFQSIVDLVWDKEIVGLGKVWRHQHELILASRWDTSVFYENHTLRSDIIKVKATPSKDRDHPVEKPIQVFIPLIEPTTKIGDIVLEPFMGSGTTLEACKELGRKCIGIEIEEKYCEIAANRCRQTVMELNL